MSTSPMFHYYELECDGNVIRNGQYIKIRNDWRRYVFWRVEHDAVEDKTNIVVIDHHGEKRVFHISRLEGRVVKRSLKQ